MEESLNDSVVIVPGSHAPRWEATMLASHLGPRSLFIPSFLLLACAELETIADPYGDEVVTGEVVALNAV